jgi:hypothetical protein
MSQQSAQGAQNLCAIAHALFTQRRFDALQQRLK